MPAPEWTAYCRAEDDFAIEGDAIQVTFGNGRKHRVEVHDSGESYEFLSVVVRQRVTQEIPDLAVRTWRRNRATNLMGFRIDRKGRLVGDSWIPKAGLAAEEFRFVVRLVAMECDRLEFILTGNDIE